MNTRKILIASVAALAMGVGTSGVAATDTQNPAGGSGTTQTRPGPGSMMQAGQGLGPMMQAGQGLGPMGQNGRAEGMMGGPQGNAANMMTDGPRARGADEGEGYGMRGVGPRGWGMMGAGMGGEGMMGMMGACSNTTGANLDPKTAMQMRGEMMRAMGDILIKYADKIQSSPAKP